MCNDDCSDNVTFIFQYKDRNRDRAVTCEQISTSQRMMNRFCSYESVKENCAETCDTCLAPSQSPSQTPSQFLTKTQTQQQTTDEVQKPIASPTNAVSPRSSKAPSKAPSVYTTCDDLVGVSFFVEGEGEKNCEWLAARKSIQEKVCVMSQIAFHICEETCGKCSDTCFDDSSGTFPDLYRNGVTRNCAWLADRIAFEGGKYCEDGRPAREICLETCGICD